ncbi:GTP-binding protein REM 1 [Cimex lectularius]|uniref:Uncharacterized protein n=1 Tax=Cimex lectularius TaxID=79782 RepID=A0A8I6RBC6_CIMLE|nr:GTP-binding protein REM 1 [Cimex lectularius]
MSGRRGSVCEVTSPDGRTFPIEELEEKEIKREREMQRIRPSRRRMLRDLSNLSEARNSDSLSPTHVSSNWTLSRNSTPDLFNDLFSTPSTRETNLSRTSSTKGLSFLASRRSSKGSEIAPLPNLNIPKKNFNQLQIPVADHARPRVCSLPEKSFNPRLSDDLYRLRNFCITNKGVVNYGDSIRDRRSRSNTSINSTNSRLSPPSPWQGSCCSQTTEVSSETFDIPKYRVVLLGESGVGKTALVSQFMTSEYMNTYDASLDDEFGEKTVCILLDGEESEVVFIDHPSAEMSVENNLSTYEPHAAIVVYSVIQKETFKVAEDILNYLWRESYTKEKAVILVGNKVDLARARTVATSEGKALAASRDCKFIETSSGIQHNVDELLVGILKQIRLREAKEQKKARRRLHSSKTSLSLYTAKEILAKVCLSEGKSKSCENLHVL